MGSPRAKDKEAAGQASPKHHKNGDQPGVKLDDRGCTDIIVCLMFVGMIVVMVAITGFAFGSGSLERIATKYDMQGQSCGGDYPRKLFTRLMPGAYVSSSGVPVTFTPSKATAYYSVCISECPNKGSTNLKYLANTEYPAGDPELATWNFDTDVLLGHCVPSLDQLEGMAEELYAQMNSSMGSWSKYMSDIAETWRLILVMGVVALAITLIYLFLLRWITKPLLYVSLFLILILGALLAGWCLRRMSEYPKGSEDYNYSLAGGCVAGVLTLLYVIFLCCNWTNIAIGADIMAAAGEFVSTNPRIAIVPFICYVLCLGVVAWYAAVNVYLYSTGTPKYVAGAMFAQLEETKESHAMFWIFMFGFFWIVAFIIAILQFTIAATTALWYFQGSNSDAPSVSVTKGVWWAFRYHLGSLAFGSLLIAIVTMIKVLFEYFAKQAEKMGGDNVVVKAILCYARCMIWCLDACVKFISENAYIQVAINGTSFCESAKNSFFMIIRNPGTYAAMNIVGWIMTAIGKCVIMGLSAYLTIVLAHENVLTSTPGAVIHQPFVPAFIVLLFAYMIGSLFISIFDFACLTILQCFLTCKEVMGKDGGKVFAPKSLRSYLIKAGEEYDDDGDDGKKEKKESGKEPVKENKME